MNHKQRQKIITFIRNVFDENTNVIPLHAPHFSGNEKEYILNTIETTFVSSVGKEVNHFEEMICNITGAKYAIATVNGTSALHIALILAGVQKGDDVITQPLSFIATSNAISYCNAKPVFIDVDRNTLGLSPDALEKFLTNHTRIENKACYNSITGRRITACVPMHTFGHPCQIDKIVEICNDYHIAVVEDAAESLGSLYKGLHTGIFGKLGIISFNGNKIATSGGGGVILTNDKKLAEQAKHITTTAKLPHPYEYKHDTIGYNYRLPNLNAALACAQLEQLDSFIKNKRELAGIYSSFFQSMKISFIHEPKDTRSNYWLNTIILPNLKARNDFLKATNEAGIMTRPCWQLTNKTKMFKSCFSDRQENAEWFENRLVNLPSSVRR